MTDRRIAGDMELLENSEAAERGVEAEEEALVLFGVRNGIDCGMRMAVEGGRGRGKEKTGFAMD